MQLNLYIVVSINNCQLYSHIISMVGLKFKTRYLQFVYYDTLTVVYFILINLDYSYNGILPYYCTVTNCICFIRPSFKNCEIKYNTIYFRYVLRSLEYYLIIV